MDYKMMTDVLYSAIVAVCAFATGYRFGRVRKYVYGACGPGKGRVARKHRNGSVEFIVWRAGTHGHTQDFWYPLNSFWWGTFTPYPDQ